MQKTTPHIVPAGKRVVPTEVTNSPVVGASYLNIKPSLQNPDIHFEVGDKHKTKSMLNGFGNFSKTNKIDIIEVRTAKEIKQNLYNSLSKN